MNIACIVLLCIAMLMIGTVFGSIVTAIVTGNRKPHWDDDGGGRYHE